MKKKCHKELDNNVGFKKGFMLKCSLTFDRIQKASIKRQ